MKSKTKILVAIDLSEEARAVMQRAIELAQFYDADIHLIHVIEPVALNSPYEISPSLPDNMQTVMEERAKNFIDNLLKEYDRQNSPRTVCIGSIKQHIIEYAKDNDIKLIVVGTHGRHGIGLLLGSTATSVLHGTPCDVYAVKI